MKINNTTPKAPALTELGERLARVRKQQRLTQQQLAAEAGLGIATLRRIEDGKDAQLGSWIKLMRALDMSAAIDGLLPENYQSPMATARKAAQKRRKGAGKTLWGDQQS